MDPLAILGSIALSLAGRASWDAGRATFAWLRDTGGVDFHDLFTQALARAIERHSSGVDPYGRRIGSELLAAVKRDPTQFLLVFGVGGHAVENHTDLAKFWASIQDSTFQRTAAIALARAYFPAQESDLPNLLTGIITDVICEYQDAVVHSVPPAEALPMILDGALRIEGGVEAVMRLLVEVRDSMARNQGEALPRTNPLFLTVPPPGVPLVGRDEQLDALRAGLTQGGTMAITALNGLPGVGKTALALALAYDEQIRLHFTGGVLWAGLGPSADPSVVLGLWATALNVDVSEQPAAWRRAEIINAHLQRIAASRPFLVVIDDAWTWEAAEPFRHFDTPGNALLLTSRIDSLARDFMENTGREPVTVPELPLPEGVILLSQLCSAAYDADPMALGDLAREVGGLPLALILMGRYLAHRGRNPRWVRSALDELRSTETRLKLPDTDPRPGLSGTPISLQATIELSLDALPDDATRSAFAQLSVFAAKPADFSREAALAVWALTDSEGDALLHTLSDRALLEIAGPDRFTLHQILSAVAAARLGSDPEPLLRHADFYARLAATYPTDWPQLEAELPQMRHAWQRLESAPDTHALLPPFALAAEDLLVARGFWADAATWLQRALAVSSGETQFEPALLTSLANLASRRGELKEAEEMYRKSLAIDEELGRKEGMASDYGNLGNLYRIRGDLDTAEDMYRKSLALFTALGSPPMIAKLTSWLEDLPPH